MSFLKQPTYRSEAWRRAVASLPCACCMREGMSQCAHANHRGKGLALKAPDCWSFPLCPDCHRDFDQGKLYAKLERRDLADEWIIQTIKALADRGLVKP